MTRIVWGIGRKLGSAALSLAILITLTFVLVHIAPGSPVYQILGPKASPASIRELNHALGLDLPFWQQYFRWWIDLAHGQLGTSYAVERPVGSLIVSYELNTLSLQVVSLVGSLLIALALGLAHGVYYDRTPGRVIGGLELALYAMPSFFSGTLLILFFSMQLGWFPAGGLENLRLAHQTVASNALHMALPAVTIVLLTVPVLSRYFAQSVHEELGRDYVRSAAARGASPSRILVHHVIRNAMRPLVTVLGLSLPSIFAGGVVVETVFSYPGLGWLLWRSALAQDYPVLIGIVLVIGILTVLGNLLADIANTLLDPRTGYA
ncbi:ABC transporter permease [Lichenicoccus sp.]|uniref:ABC transporter permease n=1 Tax=Lichenicoccus sp. TaxID=2781899 RepID=UPI003D0E981C